METQTTTTPAEARRRYRPLFLLWADLEGTLGWTFFPAGAYAEAVGRMEASGLPFAWLMSQGLGVLVHAHTLPHEVVRLATKPTELASALSSWLLVANADVDGCRVVLSRAWEAVDRRYVEFDI